jgi:hypothetical protein
VSSGPHSLFHHRRSVCRCHHGFCSPQRPFEAPRRADVGAGP